MDQIYDHHALSVNKPQKAKCGDASFAGKIRIQGEEYVLLMVADGVSHAPKDWLASQSTVNIILDELSESVTPVPQTLQTAIVSAHEKICAGVEDTFGMLSTLSVVLFSLEKVKLWWYNVGDSRIFGLKNGSWIQLTTDDSTNKLYKENGRVVLRNGMPVMKTFLTKAIGGTSSLKVELMEISATEYEAVILTSDGFYELPGFKKYANQMAQSANIEKMATEIKSTISSKIWDDASFSFLRIPSKEKINLRTILEQEISTVNIPTAAVLGVLESELRLAITKHEHDYLARILDFMEESKLFYNKDKMIELLELMIKHHCPARMKMISIIRKL